MLTSATNCPLCRHQVVRHRIPAQGWTDHLTRLVHSLAALPDAPLNREQYAYLTYTYTHSHPRRRRTKRSSYDYLIVARPVLAVNRVAITSIKGKATKKELLQVLNLHCKVTLPLDGYAVPPERMASMDFIKLLLKGDKKMVKSQDIWNVSGFEKYESLSLANLIEYSRTRLPQLFDYLPGPLEIKSLCRE